MKLRKRLRKELWIAIGIAVIVLVVFVGMWFWALGAVASEAVPQIRINATTGPVQIKKIGQTNWSDLTQSVEAKAGDVVRTGEGGHAEIRWGDRGVTRIDVNSEVTIEAVPKDLAASTDAVILLRISAGREWTRLLKLLDVSSEAKVTVGTVVATVRGTAFGVGMTSASGTDVAVTKSVVSIGTASGTQTLIREGQWGSFSSTGASIVIRDLTNRDVWVRANAKADQSFDNVLRQELERRFAVRHISAPAWVVTLSEDLHLALTSGMEKSRFQTGYALRDLAQAIATPDQVDRILSRVRDLHADPQALLRDLRLVMALERTQLDPRVLTSLQNLRGDLLNGTKADQRYALALDIDDRIDDVVFSTPEVLTMTPDARIARINILELKITDWQNGNGDVTGHDRLILDAKAAAMRDRLVGARAVVTAETAQQGLSVAATSTESGASVATSTTLLKIKTSLSGEHVKSLHSNPKIGSIISPSTSVPTSSSEPLRSVACAFQRLTLFAKPNSSIMIGDPVALTLFATCLDGTTKDVTSEGTFSSAYRSDGSIKGSTFISAHDGRIVLYGTFPSGGVVLSAHTMIDVSKAPRQLIGVTVTTVGPTALTTGQSAPLQATVSYSDGTTSDVTYQCTWSTSNPKLGIISSQRFQSLSGVGTDMAICTYTESGVSKSGGIDFTISLDSALTPSGGGGTITCAPNGIVACP